MNYYAFNPPGASNIQNSYVSWKQFPARTEVTDEAGYLQMGIEGGIDDNENALYYNRRDILRDFSPDNPMLASDEPRRDTWAKGQMNLRFHGTYGGERFPWKNDDYDTQFHDADPRGWQEDQNWQMHRRDVESRIRRGPFRNDSDYSIPGDGQRVEDIQEKIKFLRDWIRPRLNWFDESRGSIASGRGPIQYNTKGRTELNAMEDTSATIDTSAVDLESLKDINTIISNNVHTGGRYFDANTTTDHRVTIAANGYIPRRLGLEDPVSQMRRIDGDRKINPVRVEAENKRDIMRFLSSRSKENRPITQGAERFADSDKSRYNRIMEMQDTPSGRIVIADIMALLGVTESEIKYINSMQDTNKTQKKQMLACVAEMIVGLENLPPNARLSLRDELLWERVKGGPMPRTRSGVARTEMSVKAKEILRGWNKKSGALKNGRGREAFGDPEIQLRELLSSNKFFVSKRRVSRRPHVMTNENGETPRGYEDINQKGGFLPCNDTTRAGRAITEDRMVDESIQNIRQTSAALGRMIRMGDDNLEQPFGEELHFDATLRAAPIAYSTNKARFNIGAQ